MQIVICASHKLPDEDSIKQQVYQGLQRYLSRLKEERPRVAADLTIVTVGTTPIVSVCDKLAKEGYCKHTHQKIKWDLYPKLEAPKETYDDVMKLSKLIYLIDDSHHDENFSDYIMEQAIDKSINLRRLKLKGEKRGE